MSKYFNELTIEGDVEFLQKFNEFLLDDEFKLSNFVNIPDDLDEEQISEWQEEQWGCVEVEDSVITSNHSTNIVIEFETLDNYPDQFIGMLSKMFPSLNIVISFYSLQSRKYGESCYHGGEEYEMVIIDGRGFKQWLLEYDEDLYNEVFDEDGTFLLDPDD